MEMREYIRDLEREMGEYLLIFLPSAKLPPVAAEVEHMCAARAIDGPISPLFLGARAPHVFQLNSSGMRERSTLFFTDVV